MVITTGQCQERRLGSYGKRTERKGLESLKVAVSLKGLLFLRSTNKEQRFKFKGTATELIYFVINVENGNNSEIPSFTAGDLKNVLVSMLRGSAPGKDGAQYENIIKKWEQVKNDVRKYIQHSLVL